MDYLTLREQIYDEIRNNPSVKKAVKSFNKKIKNKTADFRDAELIAEALAEATSEELQANPPGEDLGEYAEEIIAPVYKKMQLSILAAAVIAQKIYNKKAGIDLKPAEVAPDESRIVHIVARYREAPSIDDVSFLLENYAVQNIFKAAVTDTIRENAWHMNNAGLETYVTRDDGSGCCDWCASMTGTYSLYNIPKDFWAVHKGCSCQFFYKTKKTSSRVFFSTDDSGKITRQSK